MNYGLIAALSVAVWAAYAPNAAAQTFKQMIDAPENFCMGEFPNRRLPPSEQTAWVNSCKQLVNNNRNCMNQQPPPPNPDLLAASCKDKVYQELARLKKS